MAHLIDKDALVAEIERRIKFQQTCIKTKYRLTGKAEEEIILEYKQFLSYLDTFDTLEVKEVDLEKELIEWHKEHFQKSGTFIGMSGFYLTNSSQMELAKHFFELGLSVSNSTKVAIPDIDDVLKENGVNPYSKEAKIIKESYFMAIEKLAQKGEKV